MRTTLIALLSAATLAAVPAAAFADGGPTQPPGTPPPAIAAMLCKVEAAKDGKDAFVAKYGDSDPISACAKQELATVQAALASCKSAGSRDAMKACVAKAIGLPAPSGKQGGNDQSGSGQNGQGGPGQGGPGQGSGRQGGPGQGGPGQGQGRGNGGSGNGRPGGQRQNRK